MARLSQADLAAITASLTQISGRSRADLLALLSSVDLADRAAITAALGPVWADLVGTYGAMSAVLARDVFSAWASASRVPIPDRVIRPVDPARALGYMAWAIGRPDSLGNLQQVLDELTKQPYRSQMAASASAAGVRYARIPYGKTCGFCLMLASRGAVYETAATAGEQRKYHGDCDCQPVPVKTEADLPSGYDPDALYAEYLAAQSGS